MKLHQSEHQLQNTIADWLGYNNWLWWRNNSGGMKDKAGHWITMGKPGLPDLFAVKDGVFVGIEVKVGSNRPTDLQNRMLLDLQDHGAVTIVAYSISDVATRLKDI